MIRQLRTILAIGVMPLLWACHTSPGAIKSCSTPLGRTPNIDPDYAGITIPPNIAPLNFKIAESCRSFMAEFSSKNGEPVRVVGQGGSVHIPPGKWRKLLEANRGEPLHIALFLQDSSGQWLAANPIHDTIAAAPIDHYVTYRVLSFLYNHATDIEERERDLESFHERVLLNTANYPGGCCNCHTPLKNDPGSFVLQSRGEKYGSTTLICSNGTITPVSSRLGYTSWHPSGKLIAFSVYKVEQCFHTVGGNFIEAYDKMASVVIYDTRKKAIDPVPTLADARALQTWPCWSPNGRSLYFCAAPVLWSDFTQSPPENYDKVRFSLCRIGYDPGSNAWGAVDTVLSSGQTGLSITQPRISPDGRFLLFCMHDHGGYPHTQKTSDIYMMDLATKEFRRLDINSEYSESWHGWSSNGRWMLFSSKRDDGLLTRLCFSFIDASGRAHKAFVMPQEDPAFYDSFVKCFNVPEFATAPVKFDQRDLLKAIRFTTKIKVPIPAGTGGTALAPTPHLQ